MPAARFEPAIPASMRPQIHTIDRAATTIDYFLLSRPKYLPLLPIPRHPQYPILRHSLPVLSQYPPLYAWKIN